MRKTLKFAFLFCIYAALGYAAQAQSFTAKWTNSFANPSVCASGVTANCVQGTIVTGTANGGTAVTLCTGAGAAQTCTGPMPAGWSVFTSWTILAEVQYFGATGPVQTTTVINSAAGGNQISVQNLLILAPTNVTATIQ